MENHVEVDGEKYYEMYEVLPPVYIKELDGLPIKNCFACSEAYTHSDKTVVLSVYYKKDGKYYETLAEVFKCDAAPILDTGNAQWSRDNIAITWSKKLQSQLH
jgi:hypothetical protein